MCIKLVIYPEQHTESKCKAVPAHETKTFGGVKVKVPSSLILVLDGLSGQLHSLAL